MNWKVIAAIIVVLVIIIAAIGIVVWWPAKPKPGPSPRPEENPVTVQGRAVFDSGNPVSGARISVSIKENTTPAAETSTASNGSFRVVIHPDALPARTNVAVVYKSQGMPEVRSARCAVANHSLLEVGTIVLPSPAGARLRVTGSSATSEDGSVRLSGLPLSVNRVFAKAFDPSTDRDAFPGDFSEMGGPVGLESAVFLWAEALDASGNPVTEFRDPLTVRVRVGPAQWPVLVDVSLRTDRIEVPMYSFDEKKNIWVQEAAPGWLVNAYGAVLPETTLKSLLDGTYPGVVFAVFNTKHLSWINCDFPYSGPWTVSYLDPSMRMSGVTLEAMLLAETIFQTSWANKAYSAVNQRNVNLLQEFPDGAGPEIATFEEDGETYGEYRYSPKEDHEIFANEGLWEKGGSKRQETVFILAVTILHETAHWKHNMIRNHGKYYAEGQDVGGEAGYHIEKHLFGKTIWWDDLLNKNNLATGDKAPISQDQLEKLCDRNWWVANDASFSQQFWDGFWGAGGRDAPSQVKLDVTVPRQSYCLNESISIDVKYTNPGPADIRVLRPVHPYGYPLYFEIRDPEGKMVPSTGPLPKFQPPPEDYLPLPSEGSLNFSVNLSHLSYYRGGGFQFLQSGNHTVTVFYSSHFGLQGARSNTVTLHIASGEARGTVRAAATGGPIPGARVRAGLWGTTIASTTAGSDGRYRFGDLPAGGSLSFTASANEYLPRNRDGVSVLPGQSVEIDFALEQYSSCLSMKVGQFDDGSPVLNLSVFGDLVFIASGFDGLKVLNISNPSTPQMVCQTVTRDGFGPIDFITNLATDGSRAYLINDSQDLIILDVTDISNVKELSRIKVGGEKGGTDIVSQGSYVYVSNGTSLSIIDASNPRTPVLRGQYIYNSNTSFFKIRGTGFDVKGDYAYLPNVTNLVIVDIRDPAAPRKVGIIDNEPNVNVVVDGGYAYIHRIGLLSNSLAIADVRNPSSPSIIGRWNCFVTLQLGSGDFAIKDRYLYLATGEMGLQVFDKSDPQNPQMVNRFSDGGTALDVAICGNLTVLANAQKGLEIVHAATPGLVRVGNFSDGGSAHAVVIDDGYAYVADDRDGLEILDISNPHSPSKLGQYIDPEGGRLIGFSIQKNHAFVISDLEDMQIVNMTNKAHPVLESRIDCGGEPGFIVVNGPYAYMGISTYYSSLHRSFYAVDIFDVSDPGNPRRVSHQNVSDDLADDMVFDGRYLYLTFNNPSPDEESLIIMDAADAAAPRNISDSKFPKMGLGGHEEYLGVSGSLIITASGDVIDISYPSHPIMPERPMPIPFTGRDFAVEGNLFYCFGEMGLFVLDASDPASPQLIGGFYNHTSYWAEVGIAISGNHVFLADGTLGLVVLQLG